VAEGRDHIVRVTDPGGIYAQRWFGATGRYADATPLHGDASGGSAADVVLESGAVLSGSIRVPAAPEERRYDVAVLTPDKGYATVASGVLDAGQEAETWTTAAVPSGLYTVEVTVTGFDPARPVASPVQVTAGESVTGLDVTLRARPPVPGPGPATPPVPPAPLAPVVPTTPAVPATTDSVYGRLGWRPDAGAPGLRRSSGDAQRELASTGTLGDPGGAALLAGVALLLGLMTRAVTLQAARKPQRR
jgi:hypothetical protein